MINNTHKMDIFNSSVFLPLSEGFNFMQTEKLAVFFLLDITGGGCVCLKNDVTVFAGVTVYIYIYI